MELPSVSVSPPAEAIPEVDAAAVVLVYTVGASLLICNVGFIVGAWLVPVEEDVGAALGGELSLNGAGVAVSSILLPLSANVSSIKQVPMMAAPANTNRLNTMVI